MGDMTGCFCEWECPLRARFCVLPFWCECAVCWPRVCDEQLLSSCWVTLNLISQHWYCECLSSLSKIWVNVTVTADDSFEQLTYSAL
jgi:hypothetical protein